VACSAPPPIYGSTRELLLDALVFVGNDSSIHDVMIGGAWVVRDRVHPAGERERARFRQTIARLLA